MDAAARFIGPFVGKGATSADASAHPHEVVYEALSHLQAINAAEQAAAPDAPYDGSLVGVMYGLLDLITVVGIIPSLSQGVTFGQRPQSMLVGSISVPSDADRDFLSATIDRLLPILEQDGSGVQPLLSQRILPDIISALADLAGVPSHCVGGVLAGAISCVGWSLRHM